MKKNISDSINVDIVEGDFGFLDFLFSPTSKKHTFAEKVTAGRTWLTAVYNELKPSASYATFMDALTLDSYNQRISDEDFQDFLETVGFNVLTSPSIGDKVKASLVKSLSVNKNMLPSRKSISSAFLNPDNVRWTYWDAVKMTAADAATSAVNFSKTVAEGVGGAASLLTMIIKYRTPIIIGAVGVFGYFLYTKRDIVVGRLSEKALKTIGLGA